MRLAPTILGQHKTIERIHSILFVGIGLGVLLSYGLGTGSYSALKWTFLFVGAGAVLVGAVIRLIQNRRVQFDKITIALIILNLYAALSLLWSPDPDGGLLQLPVLATISVLML